MDSCIEALAVEYLDEKKGGKDDDHATSGKDL